MKDNKLNEEDSNEDQTLTSSCVRDQIMGVKYASNESKLSLYASGTSFQDTFHSFLPSEDSYWC